jgi:glutaconate CoA-transferase subunit A
MSLGAALHPVENGCLLALGGFTLYRRPIAAVLAIIQRGVREISLLDNVAAFAADLLIGAGCVTRIHTCYIGMEILGVAPMYRLAIEEGRLEAVPESESTLAFGLRAARARTDFVPARIFGGTEMLDMRPDLHVVRSPYSEAEYVAVPALYPQVTVLHALMADECGNAVLGSELSLDADLAAASDYTVVTAERLVTVEEISLHGADVLGGWVDAVVEQPRGAWPTACHPIYGTDMSAMAAYMEACAAGRFDSFVAGLPGGGGA